MFRQLLEHEVVGKELIYMQRWREILGKEREACAFKLYQLHEQTDQLSILKIIPMNYFDRSGLSKFGDKWGYLFPFITK